MTIRDKMYASCPNIRGTVLDRACECHPFVIVYTDASSHPVSVAMTVLIKWPSDRTDVSKIQEQASSAE